MACYSAPLAKQQWGFNVVISILRAGLAVAALALAGCSVQMGIDRRGVAADTAMPADGEQWFAAGRSAVEARAQLRANTGRARNVILFIADGMGISTITAARIFDGQSRGESGEENSLSFETFPYVALVKTYNTDAQTPDSAGTASAMNTGVKTRIGAINTWSQQHDCYGPVKTFPAPLAQLLEQRGLATGIVSTARVTHATPAAVYGHSPSRAWESDTQMPPAKRAEGCRDLADQLINFPHGDGIDLVLGGGRKAFLPAGEGGERVDRRNLLQEWLGRSEAHTLVTGVAEFRELSAPHRVNGRHASIMGLFTASHMSYEADRQNAAEPSLAEMTGFAIDHLSHNKDGYFLMVEGARVDHAHHSTNAYRALSDAQAFSEAVRAALQRVDLDDTLILVTADHSHVFTIGGYPPRGNPILGLVRGRSVADRTSLALDEDGRPFTTLGYYNGPHLRSDSTSPLTDTQAQQPDYKQQAAVRMQSETHGGEDVALFATGPSAYLVGGVIEQNVIFHIMARALGVD